MRAESQPHHRDTPPEDVYVVEAGLLARGSSLLSGLPKTLADFSDLVGQRLAAYSCGGSSGVAPASLLAPGQTDPGEPRRLQLRTTIAPVNIGCPDTVAYNPSNSIHRSPLRHAFGDDRLHDGGIQRLVDVKPDRCIEFGAGLHAIDHLMCSAVPPDGGEQILLGLVGDA